jgi:purine-binding chemotaxis protein CheW
MTDAAADHYILFVVAGTTYALPSRDVAHVEMVEEVTRVPNAAAFVEGVVFSRGQVVPAINTRARFGMPRAERDLRTRLLVVNAGGRTVGLLVDACREFLTIPASSVQPPGDALVATSAPYIAGVATLGERMIVIVDLEPLLNPADQLQPERNGAEGMTGEIHGSA